MPKRGRPHQEALLDLLKDPDTAMHYLNASLNDSPSAFLKALRNVAEAQKMATVAADAGVARESLYRTLSSIGNPRLNTLIGILKALGLAIRIDVPTNLYDELPSEDTDQKELAAKSQQTTVIPIRSKNGVSVFPSGKFGMGSQPQNLRKGNELAGIGPMGDVARLQFHPIQQQALGRSR